MSEVTNKYKTSIVAMSKLIEDHDKSKDDKTKFKY